MRRLKDRYGKEVVEAAERELGFDMVVVPPLPGFEGARIRAPRKMHRRIQRIVPIARLMQIVPFYYAMWVKEDFNMYYVDHGVFIRRENRNAEA